MVSREIHDTSPSTLGSPVTHFLSLLPCNKQCYQTRCIPPTIDAHDCIDHFRSAKFVSTFDLLKRYWQVPLTKSLHSLTPSGLYSYQVMPFGLQNAPAMFQQLMNSVVGGLEGVAVYVDDMVVYSDDWDTPVALSVPV